ncbi:MAG: DUF835 domain-containing protein [Candidatus Poseidoniales archaeon]
MSGLQMFDSKSPTDTYRAMDDRIERAIAGVHCYSRLPMRQLLRHVSSNKAEMWWLSEQESPRSVPPIGNELLDHVRQQTSQPTSLVIVEGVDWLVSKTDERAVMKLMQEFDELARTREFTMIFPVDSLSLNATFWARMCSLAPKIQFEHDAEVSNQPPVESMVDASPSIESASPDTIDDVSPDIVHLVNLPSSGFTHTILARRMLQWKRMGFDLSALEPALSINDMHAAHLIYEKVERTIQTAIDTLRRLEHERKRLTVTERELFNYRLMALNDVDDTAEELETLLSSR